MKFSKIIFALFCVLFVFCASVTAQSSEAQGVLNSTQQNSSTLPDETTLPIGGGTAAATDTAALPKQETSTVWIFFRMVFVLVVIVVCIYFVMNFMKKKMGGGITEDDTFLRKVAAISIAPGKSVQIVTLLDHAYLLGVTDNSIDLLGEINDKELVDAMNTNADRNENTARARNFGDILNIFLNPKNAASEQKKSKANLDEFFKAQREKINGGE